MVISITYLMAIVVVFFMMQNKLLDFSCSPSHNFATQSYSYFDMKFLFTFNKVDFKYLNQL